MRPVDEATELIPLVHAPETHPIPDADRNPVGEIDIVSNQHRLPVAHIEDETLVPRSFVVVGHDTTNDAGPFDPRA